jgi:hypothetical protein
VEGGLAQVDAESRNIHDEPPYAIQNYPSWGDLRRTIPVVEIGLIDFQGGWEEWETVLSFSTLSTHRISTVCFGCQIRHAAASEG